MAPPVRSVRGAIRVVSKGAVARVARRKLLQMYGAGRNLLQKAWGLQESSPECFKLVRSIQNS
eukprot:7636507-Alexandrium_andersonii.AAC.1